jgi:hypothetical protein
MAEAGVHKAGAAISGDSRFRFPSEGWRQTHEGFVEIDDFAGEQKVDC